MKVYAILCNDKLRFLYDKREKAIMAFSAIVCDIKHFSSPYVTDKSNDRVDYFRYYMDCTGLEYIYCIKEVEVK
jgi:hypothetical protein